MSAKNLANNNSYHNVFLPIINHNSNFRYRNYKYCNFNIQLLLLNSSKHLIDPAWYIIFQKHLIKSCRKNVWEETHKFTVTLHSWKFLNKSEKIKSGPTTPLRAILSLSTLQFFFIIRSTVYTPALSFLYLIFFFILWIVWHLWFTLSGNFSFVLTSTCVIFSGIFAVFLLTHATVSPPPSLYFSFYTFFLFYRDCIIVQ